MSGNPTGKPRGAKDRFGHSRSARRAVLNPLPSPPRSAKAGRTRCIGRDTKLDRDVALKVLPQAFTDDPDRLGRFEREAKVLASLNHPNIGHIYGLEEARFVAVT